MKEEKTFLKSRHSIWGALILVVLVIGFIVMVAEVYGQELELCPTAILHNDSTLVVIKLDCSGASKEIIKYSNQGEIKAITGTTMYMQKVP